MSQLTALLSVDPRTGQSTPSSATPTSDADVDRIVTAAAATLPVLQSMDRRGRAKMLEAIAAALLAERERLVEVCASETGLDRQRLTNELTRTAYQLRFLGQVAVEGSYLDLTIDHARDSEMGPTPDLRLMNMPIGVVAVFTASNFPFAFSVAGGDVASALAAGCPVVVKAHSSHPQTSVETYAVIQEALRRLALPAEVVGIVYGRDAGRALVQHHTIKAVGFTGSVSGSQALGTLIDRRPDPIPFFGELGSVNPLVVTPAAAENRAREIAEGAVASFTLGTGQFCTKPGVLFVPDDPAGDALVAAAEDATRASAAGYMLNQALSEDFEKKAAILTATPGARVVTGQPPAGEGFSVRSHLITVDADKLDTGLFEECFGPLALIIRYRALQDVITTLAGMPGALGAAIHAEGDDPDGAVLARALQPHVGRIVWNGYPTGVAVTWATHHGGTWPAVSDARYSAVGALSIRRWLRPIAWQNTPASVLPPELRDQPVDMPRRVDGLLETPSR